MPDEIQNLTHDYLIGLCQRTFPDRENIQIADVQSLGSRQHEMVGFELWWFTEDGGTFSEELVARRYVSTVSWWRPDDRGKAQRETTVLRWLNDVGFRVPKVYIREFGAFGDVALFSRVPHQDLGISQRPLSEVIVPYLEPFAQTLATLHKLNPPDEVRQTLPWVTLPGALANLVAVAAQIEHEGLKNAIEQVMPRAFEIQEHQPVVVHGDYHFLNALLLDGQVSGVIDWEYSAMADPRWDVANVYMQLVDFGAAEAAGEFLELYSYHSGLQFEGPPLYNIVSSLQQWAISEWIVRHQSEGNTMGFVMAEDLIRLRDVHKRQAEMAMTMLG